MNTPQSAPTMISSSFPPLSAISSSHPLFRSRPRQFSSAACLLSSKPTPRPRNPQYAPIRIWPFALIFVGGTFLFIQIVKQRQGTAPPSNTSSRPLQ
ncbi:hypothetical protein GTA08_BOTSDO03072 [Neofusicoccum parvum]|uniref:Uncharacterized protein n=1 Tax=Neofusicoccum parvum TaxID=310453 RepID=A0ACB5SK12_9PEZI|nr:hypothetical protein GTA08_BOTSDO03072 [Neofusicoccum parvum]